MSIDYQGFNVVCTNNNSDNYTKGEIYKVVSERYDEYFRCVVYELESGLLIQLDGRPLMFKALMSEEYLGVQAKFAKCK